MEGSELFRVGDAAGRQVNLLIHVAVGGNDILEPVAIVVHKCRAERQE